MKIFTPLCSIGLSALCLAAAPVRTNAAGLDKIRFVVVDPKTRQPIPGAQVVVTDLNGQNAPQTLAMPFLTSGPTPVLDVANWKTLDNANTIAMRASDRPTVVTIPLGATVVLQEQARTNAAPPIRDIYRTISVPRLAVRAQAATSSQERTGSDIAKFATGGSNSTQAVTQGAAGVASDSNGQAHVRGEHTDISYVIDGVPLPDTLSGRQGSILIPSTIQNLEIVTGGFAPEFGQQTAAILNVTTRPGATRATEDVTLQAGDYDTENGEYTGAAPIGKYASYVLDIGANRTRNAIEPQQPDRQTAHNEGSSESVFAKFRFASSKRDALTLTLSSNPDTLQISNRTGLPDRYAQSGQGFGFLGLRNRDGTRPDVTSDNAGALGAGTILLPSQQDSGQDITQREATEFATLSWRRQLSSLDSSLLALTFLHSGQDVHNANPQVDLLNLPVDSSVEYSPTASRNVHNIQVVGSVSLRRGHHALKTGFVVNEQTGSESYQLVPASQLALNALASLAPTLAPQGSAATTMDVNGNPVYTASSRTSPVLSVQRTGSYRAGYVQDTWQVSRKLTLNYGLRLDSYRQTQNLDQPAIDTVALSPRINASYSLDRVTALRLSYNRLFNTPPLAQGALVGQAIQPETLDQYDASIERQIAPGQTVKAAYYIKQIRNQVDVGLLIPGSQIGLYSGITFQYGGIHGMELSYDISPRNGVGWDGFINYSYSIARPNGVDNTGAPVPDFNDHDQRNTIGIGAAYTLKNGATASFTLNHGSGLASSVVNIYDPNGKRTPRTRLDLRLSSGPHLFRGHGGVGLDINNLLDDRTVINFQSAFSGTRFQQARRILVSVFGSF